MRTAPVHPLFFVALFFVVLVASASAAWAQTGAPAGNPSAAPGAALPQPARAAQRAELPGNAQAGVAQPGVAQNTAQTAAAQPAARTHQLIQRIHVEGGTASIDEVRVGGETRSITVQPKGGLPAYDVQPTTGTRAWKVLGF